MSINVLLTFYFHPPHNKTITIQSQIHQVRVSNKFFWVKFVVFKNINSMFYLKIRPSPVFLSRFVKI